ncbi:hypothetical protein PV325_002163 [Microctonus aethiopoides]|uniref:Glutamate--cysteine ligase n=1 Tax=Microctonus aethiopoides TaxID=144406 RepID=A0AA39KSI5_9HYME|nr:hypothetical protein PV325_002163 [Microctonus aethiopoides]KAK0172195.1 hypothetical protein PV328_005543 [Microctonus aethiopoides]
MGVVTTDEIFTWEESKKHRDYVRYHGVLQFINLWKKSKDRKNDEFKWGDELEFMLVKFDDKNKIAKLNLISHKLLPILNEKENANPNGVDCIWRPEFGSYQLEGIPGQPYGGLLSDFKTVEKNMRNRRLEVMEYLKSDEIIMMLTVLPRMGCPNSFDPSEQPSPNSNDYASLFVASNTVNQQFLRWRRTSVNLRARRNEVLAINLPIFKDKNVPEPFREDLRAFNDDGKCEAHAKDNHVYMDATGFGMGCCCLQVTFQGRDIQEARVLYDQLTPFVPIMVALTAACPIFRGYLTEVDSRILSCIDSVDDRTPGERGLEPLEDNEMLIRTSRNGSTEWYLSEEGDRYNDVDLEYDEKLYKLLRDHEVDRILAQHIAHLFVRDSLCLNSMALQSNDETDTDLFENIQGTTWRTMRFKPPPANLSTGWRVEFRPCDIQITDFENAATACFIALLTRVILSFNLNLLIPLTKVEENLHRSYKRDAINKEKFWFQRDITRSETEKKLSIDEELCELTIDEIINGKTETFVGIIPLMNSYLDNMNVDSETRCTIQQYLDLFKKRASGKLMTDAAWIRKQVTSHPEYKKDSIVSDRNNYDLVKKIYEIQMNTKQHPEMFLSY